MQSDRQLSLEAGKSGDYLSRVKHHSLPKYHKMKEIGINEYERYAKSLRTEMANIYWDIKEDDELTFMSLYNHLTDVYKTYNSFITSLNNIAFGEGAYLTNYNTLGRMERIVKAYRKEKK